MERQNREAQRVNSYEAGSARKVFQVWEDYLNHTCDRYFEWLTVAQRRKVLQPAQPSLPETCLDEDLFDITRLAIQFPEN